MPSTRHAPLHRSMLVLLAAASVLAAMPAAASEFGRPGGYVSGGIGGASETFSGPFATGGTGISLGQAFTVGGRVGYRAHKHIAFEAGADYTTTGLKISQAGVGTIEAKALVATGNLKLYAGDWRVQPFVVGGVGIVRGTTECAAVGGFPVSCAAAIGVSDSEVVFGGRVGGGLDFYLTRNIAVTGEIAYVIPTDTLSNLEFLTYGAQLMFRF